jgi:NTE family protein
MGADKILSIGIRYARPPATTLGLHLQSQAESVTVSEIAGVLLDSSFLDSLDNDLERLERINRTVRAIPESEWPKLKDRLRFVASLALRPSQDLGRLAADQYARFPAMLRHLLRGIGARGDTGWDLLSYLAFQPGYMQKLIELGAEDTFARRDEIEAFFFSAASEGNATSEPPALGDTRFTEKAAGHGPDTAHASGVGR